MAKVITYDAGDNIIEADGGTAGDPITPENVYDEDVANGWGVITQVSGYQCRDLYAFACKLEVGSNSVTYWSIDVVMVWAHCTYFHHTNVTWVDSTGGSVESHYEWSGGNSYDSVLAGSGTVEKCTFSHGWNRTEFSGTAEACSFRGQIFLGGSGGTWKDCLFQDSLKIQGNHILVRPNVGALQNESDGLLTVEEPFVRDGGGLGTYWDESHLEVVDPHYAGTFTVGNAHDGAWIKEQRSVYAHVTDADGNDDNSASVKFIDEGDESETFDAACDANGDTGQQIVTRKLWEDADEALTEYGPWRAEVTFGDGVVLKIPHIALDEQLGSEDQPFEVHHPDHAAEADAESGVTYADTSLTGTRVGRVQIGSALIHRS